MQRSVARDWCELEFMGQADLLAQALPYRARLAGIAFSTILASLAILAIPWLAGQMIGGAILADPSGDDRLVGLLIGTLFLTAIFNAVTALVSAATSTRILADLRKRIFTHVIGLPMAYHEHGRQGDTLALMTYEISLLSQFLTGTLATLPATLLTALGAVIMLFWLDPVFALLVPVLMPAFYLQLKFIGRRLRSLAIQHQKAEADLFARAEQDLEMLPAIKAFTRETAESSSYASLVEEARSLSFRESRIYAVLGPVMGLVAAVAAVILVLLASEKLAAGRFTPQEMFSFLLYSALLTRPVAILANVYGQVQTARGTLTRLRGVLNQQAEAPRQQSDPAPRAHGGIEFAEVAFTYPGRDQTLAGVTLKIAAGEIVALVGDNGAGKSTLASLLLRLYEVDQGVIRLDGRDIRTIDLTELRQQIGYVPQRPLLFNGTIRANIGFGCEGATQDQITAAASLAQADAFITALPEGYDTSIGDHGVRLSGGQRQRIALARALIKDPPILVLDEATSMYDRDGEAAFIATCKDALTGRTVVLVTHRPASLALASRIFELSGGRLSEVVGLSNDVQ